MKNLKSEIRKGLSYLLIILIVLFWSCSDDSYLIDTGIHKANYEGNIYEYLQDKSIHFDSVQKIIDIANMQDVFIDDTITFFAPSNPSIVRSIRALNENLYQRGQDTVKDLSQIDKDVWKELLSLYVVKGKYLLNDIPQLDTTKIDAFGGQGFVSYGGRPMNIGVIYFDAGGVKYAGYRQLYYSYLNDFDDENNSMINVPVASSDIQPNNGAVHVLRYTNHPFGFSESNFITKALAEGIKNEEE